MRYRENKWSCACVCVCVCVCMCVWKHQQIGLLNVSRRSRRIIGVQAPEWRRVSPETVSVLFVCAHMSVHVSVRVLERVSVLTYVPSFYGSQLLTSTLKASATNGTLMEDTQS